MTAARSGPFPLVRAAYGVVLLCAPGAAIRLCTGQPAGSRARAVTRLLGARHLVQAALTAGMPNAVMLAVGAQIDVAHSASMLALAGRGPAIAPGRARGRDYRGDVRRSGHGRRENPAPAGPVRV